MLKRGDSSDAVKDLKSRLNKLGYNLTVENPNFLAKTEAAVVDFQSRHDLVPDGIVGPKTMAKIMELLDAMSAPVSPVYWKPGPFHPMFKVPTGYTHLHPYDILKSVAGEREILGDSDNPLIAHFHEHSGNLGHHSEGADYHDEVPHCSSAWNWACDGGGCYKSNNALASSWEKMHEMVGAHRFKKGDLIPRGALVNLNGHVTSADQEFIWTGSGSFAGFGSNQGNTIKTSTYSQSRIRCIHLIKPKPGTILAPIGTKPTPATGGDDESTR